MDLYLTDKTLIAQRFGRCDKTYDDAALVQRSMSGQLVQQLERVLGRTTVPRLELGCGTGLLTRHLLERLAVTQLTLNDLVPELVAVAADVARQAGTLAVRRCAGDMELADLPAEQDLVVSCLPCNGPRIRCA